MKAGPKNRPDSAEHRALALWAAECSEHVLVCFEDRRLGDARPRAAIEAVRAWARDELPMAQARKTAFAAHAAARAAENPAARAAARAAGHAAATAHVAAHASHAADYAVKAAAAAVGDALADAAAAVEREWQRVRFAELLPEKELPSS